MGKNEQPSAFVTDQLQHMNCLMSTLKCQDEGVMAEIVQASVRVMVMVITIMSYVLCNDMICLCHDTAMRCCALCRDRLRYAVLCYDMVSTAVICDDMLCPAMLLYAMLCDTMGYHAMPCHAMPCHATLCLCICFCFCICLCICLRLRLCL